MEQLRIPGPTPLPKEVMQAISRQMINHRGPEFHKIYQDITEKLKLFFQTKNDLLILTCAGTGGLEAAIVNFFSPGDKILGVSIGVFGDRFISIAKTYGANVIPLKFEMGQAADPEAIKKALAADPEIKGVIITHNETASSVTNDLKTIAPIVKNAGKLLLVDGVSSIGSIDLPVDELHIDVAVSGSQKGWMVPPGMVMLSVSQEAWQANAKAKMPRFYLDLAKAKAKYQEKFETPWTPAVSIIYGFQVALDMMLKEGIQNIFARHALIAKTARDGLKELGLTLLVKDEKIASNTVTGVMGTNGMDTKKVTSIMRDQYKIVLAGGQGALEGKIFRIGHLGYVSVEEIKDVLAHLKLALTAGRV